MVSGEPLRLVADEAPATDEGRFRAIFRSVLGYALRRTATPADAADVVSETMLNAWRRLDDMPAGAQALPWLYGVARRVLGISPGATRPRARRRRARVRFDH